LEEPVRALAADEMHVHDRVADEPEARLDLDRAARDVRELVPVVAHAVRVGPLLVAGDHRVAEHRRAGRCPAHHGASIARNAAVPTNESASLTWSPPPNQMPVAVPINFTIESLCASARETSITNACAP